VAFSRNGKLLAGCGYKSGVIWDVPSQKVQAILGEIKSGVCCVAFAPDGQLFAGRGNGEAVRYWPGEPIGTRVWRCHSSTVNALVFSPRAHLFATGSHDCTIKVWDADWGREEAVLAGHSDWVRCLDFSPDGQTLASGG